MFEAINQEMSIGQSKRLYESKSRIHIIENGVVFTAKEPQLTDRAVELMALSGAVSK